MFVNAEYERLTGYSKRDVVGHNCRILQGEDTEHHIILEMSAKLRAAEDLDVNVTNYTKSGERMLIRFVARAVNDSMGMYRYSVGAQLPIDDGGDPVGMERLDMLMKMVPKQLLVPSTPQVQQRAAATKALVNGGQLKKPVASVPQTGANGRRKSVSSMTRSDVGKTHMAALVDFTKLVWLAEPVGSLTQLIGNEQFGGEFKSFLEREYMDSAWDMVCQATTALRDTTGAQQKKAATDIHSRFISEGGTKSKKASGKAALKEVEMKVAETLQALADDSFPRFVESDMGSSFLQRFEPTPGDGNFIL